MIAAAALILSVSWFIHTRDHEPVYDGRSLTDWLIAYGNAPVGDPTSEKAANAVRHIGTNALPFLINWVDQYQPMSPSRYKLYSTVEKWGPGAPGDQFFMEIIASRMLREARAISAFEILGETAGDAAPELERIATRRDTRTAIGAIYALPCLGRAGLQSLFSIITNTAVPFWTRLHAVSSLNQLQGSTNAHSAIVFLIDCLHDPDPVLQWEAANVLGNIHLEGGLCVPALIECTRSTNTTLRSCAATSLGKCGRDARAAVLALTKLLNDPSAFVRPEATNALQLIAPEVLQQSSAL
jgi:HEAT repeats